MITHAQMRARPRLLASPRAQLLLLACAHLWAATISAARGTFLRQAALPEAFPTPSELRPVSPDAPPSATTPRPLTRPFLVTRPPLKLVDAVFHVKGKADGPHWTDPRLGMVDAEQEVGFNNAASAKERKDQKRLKLLERVTMHTKTLAEREAAAHTSRVHKDKSQMQSRVKLWEQRHRQSPENSVPESKNLNRQIIDGSGSASAKPRFVSTKARVAASQHAGAESEAHIGSGAGGGGASGYVAPQEPEKHEEDVKVAENDELNRAVEQSVKDSETLTNAEVIEHTGEEDPDNKEEMASGGSQSKESGSGDEDGPEEGGAGEKSPINKYYKWWSLSSWSPAEVSFPSAFLSFPSSLLRCVKGEALYISRSVYTTRHCPNPPPIRPPLNSPRPPRTPQLQSMVNSPSHGQLNTDVGGKRSATNTHGDDTFAAEMADVTSGAAAAEGHGEGNDKAKDGSVRFPDVKPFPAWTRKSEWLRADANFAPQGIVPPTEADQKEIEDAIKTQLPEEKELDDALDPARTKELMGAANVGDGGVQDALHNAMNTGAQ